MSNTQTPQALSIRARPSRPPIREVRVGHVCDFTIRALQIRNNVLTTRKSRQPGQDRPDIMGSQRHEYAVVHFRCSRARITEEPTNFLGRLRRQNDNSVNEAEIEIDVDSITSVEIWLGVLHGQQRLLDLRIPELWALSAFTRDFGMDTMIYKQILRPWFEAWFARGPPQFMTTNQFEQRNKQLLFPCFFFDHALGFAQLTQFLAYGSLGHVGEENPTIYENLHLPNNVLGNVKSTRGSLRSELKDAVLDLNDKFTNQNCACRGEAQSSLHDGLKAGGIYPLSDCKSIPVTVLLRRLKKFSYKKPRNACSVCSFDFETEVENICERWNGDFHGLCLDCMDLSKPKHGNVHQDYWRQDLLKDWSRGCRIAWHGQSTWYRSFMGREQEYRQHVRAKQARGERPMDDELLLLT